MPPRILQKLKSRPLLLVCLTITALVGAVYGWQKWREHSIPDIGEPFDVETYLAQTGDGEEIARITVETNEQWNELSEKHEAEWSSYYNDEGDDRPWKEVDPIIKSDVRQAKPILEEWFKVGNLQPGLLHQPDVYHDFVFYQDPVVYGQRQIARIVYMSLLDAIERSEFDAQRHLYNNFLKANSVYVHTDATNWFSSEGSYTTVLGGTLRFYLNQPEVPVDHLWDLKIALEEHSVRQPPLSTYYKNQYLAAPAIIEHYADGESGLEQLIVEEDDSTRRLYNLLYDNWLRHCDLPPGERPPIELYQHNIFIPPDSIDAVKEGMTEELEFEYYDVEDANRFLDNWEAPTYTQQIRLALLVSQMSLESMQSAWDRTRLKKELHLTRIALHLYYREHDHFPETLEELVPKYLRTLPLNEDDGLLVTYRIEESKALLIPHLTSFRTTTYPPGSEVPADPYQPIIADP